MTSLPTPELTHFLKAYEAATNSHDFANIRPLITADATYWFSDGTFEGLESIRQAFTKTWETIQEEVYTIRDVEWPLVAAESAVVTYHFLWHGFVNDISRSGSGRGTNLILRSGGTWQIKHEHLSA